MLSCFVISKTASKSKVKVKVKVKVKGISKSASFTLWLDSRRGSRVFSFLQLMSSFDLQGKSLLMLLSLVIST